MNQKEHTVEVSQVADHVTHAVIGGKQAINFGVSDDAALMNVLSKALYTDPELAVIRETLCNGWDAHVESGNTDTALHVILTDEELTIRDFGNGIPQSMIGPVYGTYGGSTKKQDTRQTGGFGLGCKSPFAYTDHFEVTSWSVADKTMTVYNMSKSNAEVGGRPAIIPLLSVPTTEQGLQVKIKLNSPRDRSRFEMLVKRIARNGEMKVRFNGIMVPVLPFNLMKHGWLMTEQPLIETRQRILVRYGHVIYPVEDHEDFEGNYNRIERLLGKIKSKGGCNSSMKIVFQAPAGQLSITPSREALSMQETTVTVIAKIFKDFLEDTMPRIEAGCYKVLNESINNVWLTGAPKDLFETGDAVPNLYAERVGLDVLTTHEDFIKRYVAYKYPEYDGFQLKDRTKRIDALIAARFGDTSLLKSFRIQLLKNEASRKKDSYGYTSTASSWFQRHIVWPLLKGIRSDPTMGEDKLFIYGREYNYGEKKILPLKKFEKRSLWGYVKFLRKIIILSHNRLDVEERVPHFPVIKHWLGSAENSFVYIVPRSPARVEAAREFFRKRGYTLIDLTVAQPWEHVEAAAPIKRDYPVSPRRKGIPTLASLLNPEGTIQLARGATETENLITNPEFVLRYNPKAEEGHHVPNHSVAVSKLIIEEWGSVGGLVVNENQRVKYLGAGAMTYFDFVLEKILDQFTKNPRIRASLPYMWDRSNVIMKKSWGTYDYKREHRILTAVYADKDLVEYFGLVQAMTDKDKLYMKMWDEFKKEGLRGTKGTYQKIEDLLATFLVDKQVMNLFDMIRKSDVLHVFDEDYLEKIMTGSTKVTPQRRTLVRDMLLQAIKA